MKKFILCTLCLILSAVYFSFSQPNQTKFRIIYNWSTSGNLFFTPWSTKNSFSNGYTSMGWMTSTSDLFGAGFAFEIDTMGSIKWARRYRGDNILGFTPMFFYDFIKSGTNYIITGSRNGNALLMSINSTGSTINFDNTYLGGSSWGNRAEEDASGNFVIAGGSSAQAINPNKDSTSIYIFKTNSGGTFQWGRSYTLTSPVFDSHDDALDVVTVSNGYVFTGYHSEDNAGDTTTNVLLFKTDFNGTLQWMNSFGALSTNEEGRRILYDAPNNQFVILGNTDAVMPFGGLFLMRTDASGNLIASSNNAYGTPFGAAVADQIVPTSTGGYAVMGWAAVVSAITYKPWLLNLTSSFGHIWTKYYNPTTLGGFFTYGEEAVNKGFIFSTLSADLVNGGWATELIKTDSQGKTDNTASSCSETNYTPSQTTYNPAQKSISPTVFTGGSGSNFTSGNSSFTPAKTTVCMVCAKPPANVTVVPASTICSGSSATLTASGGGTYSWNTGATSATIVVSPPSTSSYSVWVNVAGCDSIVPVTVTVNPGPTANITGSATICQGQFATLTASGGGTYSWSTGQTTATIVVNPSSTTTYTVVVTDASNCTNSANATVTVTSVPNANISGNTTICAGETTTLTASGGGTYSWNTGSTSATITDTPASTTSYTVTVSNGSCSSTASATVIVNSVPTAGISGNTNICLGETTTLTASGGGTYSWNTGATTTAITDAPASTTSYTVIVTGANGCTNTASVTVNVAPPPVASVSGNNTICSGASATLTASGGLTYSWIPVGVTTSVITVSPTISTTYSVIVSAGNCSDTASVQVTVNPSPTANITGNNSICEGESSTLTASGGGTYSWSTGDTTSSIIVSPTVTSSYSVIVSNGLCDDTASLTVTVNTVPVATISPGSTICSGDVITLTAGGGSSYSWNTGATTSSITVSPSSSTTYTVIVSNGSCSDTANTSVTVNPSPSANITGNNSICEGENATLTASGGGTYSWNTGDTTSSISISPTTNTSYTVTVTGANGCTASAVTTVTVTSVPVATISPNSTICAGDMLTLTAGGGTTYSWNTGQTTSSISLTLTSTSTFTAVVANGTCTDTASTSVFVNPAPTATVVEGTAVTINYGSSTTLSASGSGGTPPYSYIWNTGETTTVISVSPTATTQYCVTVIDSNECRNTDCITVSVDYQCGELFVPNAFSPNGDGKNDFFRPRNICFRTLTLVIYDRWGTKVFETDDVNTPGWDGSHKGRKAKNTATFFYILNYELVTGEEGKKEGSVSLIE